MNATSLFASAQACLAAAQPAQKILLTQTAVRAWAAGALTLNDTTNPLPFAVPGRPARPRLVRPRALPRRESHTAQGHAALIHALCHIEFNAINLAWDAVYRFRGLPAEFYGDWIRVAAEEAHHFTLLRDHLRRIGFDYGHFAAHNGLWEMALETAHDPLVRMALVPRVLEARGLDVTPGIIAKLTASGDEAAVAILQIIERDEIGHVAIGSRWFRYFCEQRGVAPELTFQRLLESYMKGKVKGPFHRRARQAAGFTEQELDYLEGIG